jgi:hypothetical protein
MASDLAVLVVISSWVGMFLTRHANANKHVKATRANMIFARLLMLSSAVLLLTLTLGFDVVVLPLSGRNGYSATETMVLRAIFSMATVVSALILVVVASQVVIDLWKWRSTRK